MLSIHWVVANHKRDGVVSVSVTGMTYRQMDAMTIEPPDPPIYVIDAAIPKTATRFLDLCFQVERARPA